MSGIQSRSFLIVAGVVLTVLLTVWTLPAAAQVDFLLDKSEYIANHPNQQVQTFAAGKAAPGDFELCGQTVDEFSSNDCFDPGDILRSLAFVSDSGIFLAGINFQSSANPNNALARVSGPLDTFEVLFDPAVNSAGMDVGCFAEGESCNSLQTIRLIDANGATIDSVQIKVSDFFNSFVGFNSTVPVARVDISGPDVLSQGVDEVRFSQVGTNIPTLSEWGMIAAAAGLAMIGVFFAVRRKRITAGA